MRDAFIIVVAVAGGLFLGWVLGQVIFTVQTLSQRRWGRWKIRQYVVRSAIDPVLNGTSIGDLNGHYLTRWGAASMCRKLNQGNEPGLHGTTYECRVVRWNHEDALMQEELTRQLDEITTRLLDQPRNN